MGMLVKLARLLMKRCKLLIANAQPLHHELLDGIGVMKGWEYVKQPVACDSWSELCDAISGKLNERLVVEVHQQLIDWDERNNQLQVGLKKHKLHYKQIIEEAKKRSKENENGTA